LLAQPPKSTMAVTTSMELVCIGVDGALPAQAFKLRLAHLRRSPALAAYLPVYLRTDLGVADAAHGSKLPTRDSDCSGSEGDLRARRLDRTTWQFALEAQGCRELQRRLEAADDKSRAALADGLRGHICDAVRSPHANFVVQKCIEVLRPAAFQFIIDELMGDSLGHVAEHKFGCRVVMRLLEHSLPHQVCQVVGVIMPSVPKLARHRYGNYVVQSMISNSATEQRCLILEIFRREIAMMCQDHFGSSVVRTVLQSGNDSDRVPLAQAISKSSGLVRQLMHSQRGQAIVKLVVGLIEVPERRRLLDEVVKTSGLPASKYGRIFRLHVEQKASSQLLVATVHAGA